MYCCSVCSSLQSAVPTAFQLMWWHTGAEKQCVEALISKQLTFSYWLFKEPEFFIFICDCFVFQLLRPI